MFALPSTATRVVRQRRRQLTHPLAALLLLFVPALSALGQEQEAADSDSPPQAAEVDYLTRFKERDADENGSLTLSEFTAGVADDQRPAANRDFRVFDFDADGAVSSAEYQSLHAIDAPEQRGLIPDPISEAVNRERRRIIGLLRGHDGNRDGRWNLAEWTSVARQSRLATSILKQFESADRRADGELTPDEIDAAIDIAFGLRTAENVTLRRPNGRVYNWRAYGENLDVDGNGTVTAEEFIQRVSGWQGREGAEASLAEVDADRNSIITRVELSEHGVAMHDTVGDFLRLDTDLDGSLSADELARNLPSWDNLYADRLIPAFDADADGKLSLMEFRMSPPANRLHDWNAHRSDGNGDGRLDLAEYFMADQLRFAGLAGVFFDHFDRDKSGFLEPSEYDFRMSLSRDYPDVAFGQLDTNSDGRLTVDEAMAIGEAEDSDQTEGLDLLVAWYKRLFERADSSLDGTLSAGEFRASPEFVAAAINCSSNQTRLLGSFLKLDTDGNRLVTPGEWLSSLPEDQRATSEVYPTLCDFNGDGQLDLMEYACLPGVLSSTERGPIPDPILSAARTVTANIFERLGAADSESRNVAAAAAAIAEIAPGVSVGNAQTWDANKDGRLDDDEVSHGVEVSFGICFTDGTPFRRRGIHVFPLGTVRDRDRNRDGLTSEEEYFVYSSTVTDEYRARVRQADRDGDALLSIAELVHAGLMFNDVFNEFLKFDSDRNGRITKQEFDENVASWQRWPASFLFSAFDADSDGEMLFLEFRASHFANPAVSWLPPRRDRNNDGRLDHAEFHAFEELHATALSKMIFDRVDRNNDGFLDLTEADFDVDFSVAPPDVAFRMLDTDRNDSLTVREAASISDSANDGSSAQEFLLPAHAAAFRTADADGNQELSTDEFLTSRELQTALISERRLRSKVLPRYGKADTDGDGTLSRDEWIGSQEEKNKPRAAAEFVVCDFDGNGRLVFSEFASLPSVLGGYDRASIPDPVADEARRVRDELVEKLSANPGLRKPSQAGAVVAETVPGLTAGLARDWDRDGNGTIDDAEAALGVEISFGVRDADGNVLRRPGGMMFDMRTFRGYDVDGDMRLSREDLGKNTSAGRRDLLNVFEKVDADGDDRLSVKELSDARKVWVDVVGGFLTLDENLNGLLDEQELRTRLPSWNSRFANQLLPAFDQDGDGVLSFAEYRTTPLGNALEDWHERRQDRDHDGRLSPDEYHQPISPNELRSLSHMFLSKLDTSRDGFLDAAELDFAVDLNRMAPDAAFSFIDLDHDGRLTRQEAVAGGASEAGEFLLPSTARGFQQADSDDSGFIDNQEAAASPDVIVAVIGERNLRKRTLPRFTKKDADQDQLLSLEEWQEGFSDQRRASSEFHTCDFDGNGKLTFAEFSAAPLVAGWQNRSPVPDPVVEEARRVYALLLEELGGENRQSVADVRKAVTQIAPSIAADAVGTWDTDRNRSLSNQEIRLGVDVTFGVRHDDGTLLRPHGGVVFNLRTFGYWDSNHDGMLSYAEYLKNQSDKEVHQERAKQIDTDGNGQLTVAELAAANAMWVDVVTAFVKFDIDGNGELSGQEINEKAQAWEQNYLRRIFPAFDDDGNGALSLREFRLTQYANPLANWTAVRSDGDADTKLSLAEFHPRKGPDLRSVSGMLLAKYDLNDSGLLDIDEWEFKFDLSKAPADTMFSVLDADANGSVTVAEVSSGLNDPNVNDGIATGFLIPTHEQAFRDADRNGNGELDRAELKESQTALAAIGSEWYLRREILPRYSAIDRDVNGALSNEEWMSNIAADHQARRRSQFAVCDFNRDGGLSFDEYLCVPGISRIRAGVVPDPVRDVAQKSLKELLSRLGADDAETRLAARAASVVAEVLPGMTLFGAGRWDSDGDTRLSDDEARAGVETAFGIRHLDGSLLRRTNGQVFRLASFEWWDANNDETITFDEMQARTSYSAEQISEYIQRLDRNGDRRLAISELADGDLLWGNTVGDFLSFDRDGDGLIGAGELQGRVSEYRQPAAECLFPAFDIDGDQSLSFTEFSLSPLGNPLGIWYSRRSDSDNDGRLSFEEYHRSGLWTLAGMSQLLFARLDQDQDGELTLNELEFSVNIRELPPEMSYALLDTDHDSRLSLTELSEWLTADAGSNADPKNASSRLMLTEDAFHEADGDGDGFLSVDEYSNQGSGLAAFLAGTSTSPKRVAANESTAEQPDSGGGSFRSVGLILMNVLIVAGLGWFLFGRKENPA